MITDKDDFRHRDGNDSDNRDGSPSSENRPSGIVKKKRPRVGDVRTTSAPPTNQGGYGNRDTNSEYRSSSYNSAGNRGDRPSYPERRPYNNNNSEGRSYNSERRPYNSGSEGRSYNNSEGRSYNNNNNSEGRSYNNDRGGYNDRRPSYNNDRPYNNDRRQGGGGGYNDRRQGGGENRFGGGNKRPSRPREVDPNQKVIERPKRLIRPVKYKENLDPSTPLRLNKYLANAGVCSRREADSYITAGDIKVNGIVVSELGAKVTRGDMVTFQDKPVELESKVYVLLNKPKNCVTTSDDPQNRKTVMDLVQNACPERIYPVGRLDRNTTGVLLLTNDGDLASKLMHPKFKKKKIYQVTLDKDVAIEDMQAIADGIILDDGEIHADSIAYVAEDVLNEIGIEIHSGRNRVVRRIFESLGYQVTKLDRVYFSGLTKKNLPRGRWRYLTEPEVNMLRMGSFE